ncbi:acid phosphatase/vanadium-dependent haloperoxidase related protein [Alicyclobacillus hesperidum URH17-3-68]|uniref:Divergent PAP2 family protein n=1 Tax=Alicyclobacillus hesperidum TaxID=89784 RepID=A0A1H2Q6A3_9BACL|nr:acid phosphatase/vanadium-dependent haloperoxidase related protein [Alicyclobacillus hesperidum URH17-3-68]GLV12784.1 hypothetical protein Heshes_04680 [Alicyclobacillus hesperidum]SDW02693.1 hypothetical protein SAMN04489725_101104 [Alicyclobacillus hesperidum]
MLHVWSDMWAAPLVAMIVAQLLKPVFVMIQMRTWDWRQVRNSGGMPSSHTAAVIALAAELWMHSGGSDPVLGIGFFVAAVVMYDAAGVRWQTGRQAAVLNRLLRDLRGQHLLEHSGEAGEQRPRDAAPKPSPGEPVAGIRPLSVVRMPWWLIDWPVLNEQVGHKPIEILGGIVVGVIVAIALHG